MRSNEQKKASLANELFAGQMVALKRSLEDMKTVKQIVRIDLFDLNGVFLLSTRHRSGLLSGGLPVAESGCIPRFFSKRPREAVRMPSICPLSRLSGKRVGYIRILYDLAAMEREFHVTAFFLTALLAGALIGGGVFANLLLTYAVIRPTAKLSGAIRKVRQGQLGEQVAIDSQDEIGGMARDFNDMSRRLRLQHEELMEAIGAKESYAGQLQVINAELEERVAERTAELQQMYEQLEREMTERQIADERNRQLQEQLSRSPENGGAGAAGRRRRP